MKERLLDVMKWGLILLIAGAVFYVVYPKYHFGGPQGTPMFRCNKITGLIEIRARETSPIVKENKWLILK